MQADIVEVMKSTNSITPADHIAQKASNHHVETGELEISLIILTDIPTRRTLRGILHHYPFLHPLLHPAHIHRLQLTQGGGCCQSALIHVVTRNLYAASSRLYVPQLAEESEQLNYRGFYCRIVIPCANDCPECPVRFQV